MSTVTIINGFQIENNEKFNRAVFGVVTREGKMSGGVGENASDEVKLAEYDKLAGYITKDGNKVKTGSFWDFDKRKMREVSKVIIVFKDLNGEKVEVGENEVVPITVKAAQIQAEKKKAKKVKKVNDEE